MSHRGGRAQFLLDQKPFSLIVLLAACSASPLSPPSPPAIVASIASIADAPPPPIAPDAPPPAPSTPPAANDRLAGAYALDELRLIALIVGTSAPRAMLVDPAGLGLVVKVGDLVARDEPLRPGDPASIASWQVEQIGRRDLTLVRVDPARPGAPPERRVLPLAPPKRP